MALIGDINIKNTALLAPMAGVTDLPFRLICREMGAAIVYTEFVSANGIIRENKKTLDMIEFISNERPIGVQIFGEDADTVGKSAKIIYDMFEPDIIDINYGCPVPKVTKKGAGSAALKNLDIMKDITSSVIRNVPNIPITVKMRSGWTSNTKVYIEAGQMLENIGVAAITLHPRTTSQKFEGKADWSQIKKLKESVSIPVIGNGDVKNVGDYINMKNDTQCDAIMIGRGALGNPWIFQEISDYEKNKEIYKKTLQDIVYICKYHFKLLKENREERVCVNLTKKHFSWYLKGFKNASVWRKKILFSDTADEIDNILEEMSLKGEL